MILWLLFISVSLCLGLAVVWTMTRRLPVVEQLTVGLLSGMWLLNWGWFLSTVYDSNFMTKDGVLMVSLAGLAVAGLLTPLWWRQLVAAAEQVVGRAQAVIKTPTTALQYLPYVLIVLAFGMVCILNYAWGPWDWDVITLYDFRARVWAQDRTLFPLFEMAGQDGARFVYYFSYPPMTSLWHTVVYLGGSNYVLSTYAVWYLAFYLCLWSILKRTIHNPWIAGLVFALVFTSKDIFLQAQTAYTNFPYTVYFVLGIMYFLLSLKHKSNSAIPAGLLLAGALWIRFVDPYYYVVLIVALIALVAQRRPGFIWTVLPVLIVRQSWSEYLSRYAAPYSATIQAFSLGSVWKILDGLTLKQILAIPDVITFLGKILINIMWFGGIWVALCAALYIWSGRALKNIWWVWVGFWLASTVGTVFVAGILFSFIYPDWAGIPGSAERLFSSLVPLLYIMGGWLLDEAWSESTSDKPEVLKEIKLIKSTFYNEAQSKAELVEFITQAPILSFAQECQKFERNFSTYQGRDHSVFVNSGSSANLAIIQALLNLGRLKKGDKVGFSTLTWSTNVMPLIQLGLQPIPIDVELDTLNVSSVQLKKVLKKHDLKMVFITNLLGFCDDIDAIAEVCQERKILFVEDNCESLGTVYQGKKLGNFGLASTFSFYVGHHKSTIEGGMVCTDDEELATQLRLVRAHGWDRNLSEQHQAKIRSRFNVNSSFYSRYTFYELGYNLRPTEIAGFLGNQQLQYIDDIVKKRQENFLYLAPKIYSQTGRFFPIRYDHLDFVSNFAVPVICRSAEIRDQLVTACAGKIEIRPVVGGDMTQQPFFSKYVAGDWANQKTTARLIHEQGLYFGNNPELTQEELDLIVQVFTTRG
jgi:CDP-6-deoxy-D-xylo-4-hexulose-3-dehydrase